MSATNHTTNYNLSQFIGTDKPAWLVDYNNDMSAIDAQMKLNADAATAAAGAASDADTKAQGAKDTADALNIQINTPGTGLAADVASQALNIQALATQAGNTPLDTTAQTLSGAINELNTNKFNASSAAGLLKLSNIKKAISVTADGVKTATTLLDELSAALTSYIASKGSNYAFNFVCLDIGGYLLNIPPVNGRLFKGDFTLPVKFIETNSTSIQICEVKASGSTFDRITISDGTVTDLSGGVPNLGDVYTINLTEYEVL